MNISTTTSAFIVISCAALVVPLPWWARAIVVASTATCFAADVHASRRTS